MNVILIKTKYQTENEKIVDLVPTVLHITGIPIVNIINWKILTDAFKEPLIFENPVRYRDAEGKNWRIENKIEGLKALRKI